MTDPKYSSYLKNLNKKIKHFHQELPELTDQKPKTQKKLSFDKNYRDSLVNDVPDGLTPKYMIRRQNFEDFLSGRASMMELI